MTQEEKAIVRRDINDVTSRMELIMAKLIALREAENISDAPDAWDNYWAIDDMYWRVRKARLSIDSSYWFKDEEEKE